MEKDSAVWAFTALSQGEQFNKRKHLDLPRYRNQLSPNWIHFSSFKDRNSALTKNCAHLFAIKQESITDGKRLKTLLSHRSHTKHKPIVRTRRDTRECTHFTTESVKDTRSHLNSSFATDAKYDFCSVDSTLAPVSLPSTFVPEIVKTRIGALCSLLFFHHVRIGIWFTTRCKICR